MPLTRTSSYAYVAVLLVSGAVACSSSSGPERGLSEDAAPPGDSGGSRSKVDAGPGLGSDGGPGATREGGSTLAAATCQAVADFVVTSTSASAVSLSWRGAPGVTVKVARKTYCGSDSYLTLATLPAGATSYTDSTVQANWNYWYELVASNGASAESEVVLATQAASDAMNGCAGGASPQPSGVTSGACSVAADGGLPSSPEAGRPDAPGATDAAADDAGKGAPIVPAFYVATSGNDSNPGTLASPFASLAKAQSAMRASSSIKTTYIRAGKYTLPTLACGGGSSCGLELDSTDNGETWSYYPPDGVDTADFNGGSTASGNGLVLGISVSSDNVTINGLSIHNFQYAGISSGGGANNLLIENNDISNGYTETNDSNPAGISCYGCANTTISHNVIHDMAMFGVSMSNVNGNISNLLVTGNVVYNTCTANEDCGALYVQDVTTTATNIRFVDNYVHDGNTFAGLNSGYGAALYADDCTSNVTWAGNVLTGRNGANTTMVHGGSNVHQTGNLLDLASYGQRAATFQTSGVSACASAEMSGNEYENNIVISAGGGGGYGLLSGSPQHTPTITNNDYYNYAGASISSGSGAYSDTNPSRTDPELSGWTYDIAAGSSVLAAPVSFPALVGNWGPPGYALLETGTAPSSPH